MTTTYVGSVLAMFVHLNTSRSIVEVSYGAEYWSKVCPDARDIKAKIMSFLTIFQNLNLSF